MNVGSELNKTNLVFEHNEVNFWMEKYLDYYMLQSYIKHYLKFRSTKFLTMGR